MSLHNFRTRLGAVALIVACVVVGSWTVPRAAHAQQDDLDRVVASVDGDPITVRDLQTFAAVNHITLSDPNDMHSPQTESVLKGVISAHLLESEVKKYRDRVDERQVDEYIANFERSNGLTDQQLRAQLQSQGHNYKEFRQHARLELQKMIMIQKEVRQKVNISPEEVKAYYDAHPQEFSVGKESFKLAQILIAVPPNASPAQVEAARVKAESIHKQLLEGADFGKLAREYSDDDSKSQGGELGDFSRGDMIDSIQNAIDHMKVGAISEPIRSVHGFHIIKLEAHEQVGLKPLAEVSGQIQEKLVSQKAQQKFSTWVDNDLAKQHYIETFN
ncbi:MAG TPA: peptidylprolyl isomerase [Candidatus Binataceae bacterium]|nr:peptidylprolyl isomerase [Candidatus Binataceae bacterium]